ncbi:argininosuccinate synthase-related protein [Actinomadura barringtoniae]|uniref:argininosuccinate synthase n=1 Tax=Actinomadura barringtoniae TaxID=1427535 RepID=A0A939PI10_9ACTN|nr:argininosuccinate synthase-related protein [Actinomadura barringtoniae]MBO2452825.1 argininosuccinate synthase-related protein [Actinomadura barringtoniae]
MWTEKCVREFDHIEAVAHNGGRVVTLFSGGLDSFYLLWRLSHHPGLEVYALSVGVGGDAEYDDSAGGVARLGARHVHAERAAVFADEFVAPAIAAQATYLGIHPVSSSLSRPLLARAAVELADEVGAEVVLHTANRSQNSLRRLNTSIAALGFDGHFGSPYELDAISRDEKQAALKKAGFPDFANRSHSGDSNLWCREFESGLLDDPEWFPVPEDVYTWTAAVPPGEQEEPEKVTIDFERGRPVALDGEPAGLRELIGALNPRVGRHGLGRYSGLEHIDSGEKVLEVREMPAACLLLHAYRQLESATVPAETMREKVSLEQSWTREAVEGRWYGSLRAAAQAFVMSVAERVTGRITYRLDRTGMTVLSLEAPDALYIRDRDAWERATARSALHFSTA